MAVTKITGAGLGLPNADGNALGGASNEWSDLYLADSSVIYFGNDQDITLTHAADTGLTTNGTFQATTITATTAVVPDASDGAALGTTSLEWSDLYLADGAVVGFGDDQDVTLTHVADTGLLLNSTMAIQFNDASQYINAPSATVLDINATDEIELNATLVDINANVEISGTATTTGVHTFTAVPVFPNNTVETADIQDDAVTLAKMASGTDGNIISYDASGNPVAIATGNDGQVLTSAGAGQPPAFENAAGGGAWTLLNAQTVSNAATLDFESIISSTYNLYAIHVFDFHPVSGGAELYLQSSEDNGSSYNSSNFQFHVTKTNADDSSYLADVSTGTTGYTLSDNVKGDNVENFHGLVFISADFNSGYQPKFWHQAFTKSTATGHSTFHTGAGTYNGSQSSATNALRLTFSTGNISAGTATIYGIAKS